MLRRIYFPLVALFWVIMNVLLWRSEMGGLGQGGTPVPAESIWERILTAPDESPLVLFHQGRRLGTVRWLPTVGEEAAAPSGDETFAPEGRVGRITGYHLDLDASVSLDPESMRRLRFQWQAEFSPEREWRTMMLRLTRRPEVWEINADASAEALELKVGTPAKEWTETFAFAELRQPRALLSRLGLPWGMELLDPIFGGLPGGQPAALALGVQWEGFQDWLRVAGARTRVYRLRARLFDRYEAVIVVSRVGEILKVELPGDVLLVSEAFAAFPSPRR